MSPSYPAEVIVMPKPEVADPQGLAIEQALKRLDLGVTGVRAANVRVGKMFHLDVEAPDRALAERALKVLADRVLTNPNIEAFQCKLTEPVK